MTEEGVVLDNVVVTGTLSNDSSLLATSYKVYPNPSKGDFKLLWENQESFDYTIYDVTGKVIKRKLNNIGNEHAINISGVSQGMYFLNISTASGSVTEKLIVN